MHNWLVVKEGNIKIDPRIHPLLILELDKKCGIIKNTLVG